MKTSSIIVTLSFSTLLSSQPLDISFRETLKAPINNQKLVPKTPEHTVRSFLYWYRKNIERLNTIQLVDQSANKPYSINKMNVATYLFELKKSGYLSEKFLNSIKHYIDMCSANLLKIKQIEGPPEGFDMDMVLLMQDYESDFKLLDKAKTSSLTKTKIKFTFASENFLVFHLAQTKDKWLIQSIE